MTASDSSPAENIASPAPHGRRKSLSLETVQKRQEAARARFEKLANDRANKAVDAIEVIGNLANPIYPKTPEDVEKIFSVLRAKIAETEALFKHPAGRKKKAVKIF